MTSKKIFTAALLFFLAVSLGAWGTKLVRQDRHPGDKNPDSENGDKVIVYYFHGHARCESCRNTENFAKIELATEEKDKERGRIRLALYEQNKPYHEEIKKE